MQSEDHTLQKIVQEWFVGPDFGATQRVQSGIKVDVYYEWLRVPKL
jgi:hypothetical protein